MLQKIGMFVLGAIVALLGTAAVGAYNGKSIEGYADAVRPALEAKGMADDTVESVKIALNPCIVKGELPYGCEKYVRDGKVGNVPIKIVLDEDK